MTDLIYDHKEAAKTGETRRPQDVVLGMGITYRGSTLSQIMERTTFHGCVNVPSPLPNYLAPRHQRRRR